MIHVFRYYTYKNAQVLISVNPENLLDAETFMSCCILNATSAISQERTSRRGVLASSDLNAENDTVVNEPHLEAGQNGDVLMHWARVNPEKF